MPLKWYITDGSIVARDLVPDLPKYFVVADAAAIYLTIESQHSKECLAYMLSVFFTFLLYIELNQLLIFHAYMQQNKRFICGHVRRFCALIYILNRLFIRIGSKHHRYIYILPSQQAHFVA